MRACSRDQQFPAPGGKSRLADRVPGSCCAYRKSFASSQGNFPLLRTYSGTDDFIGLAEMYIQTINIAWWVYNTTGENLDEAIHNQTSPGTK
jgi:hypothetical protein